MRRILAVAVTLVASVSGPAVAQAPTLGPAEAGAPAERLEIVEGFDACAEMRLYRIAVGLPARFDALGYRESRCTNTPISRTGCCVGYWQLHRIIWNDHRMKLRLVACGATWWNVRGSSPAAKWRQACAAKALYDVAGYRPWST